MTSTNRPSRRTKNARAAIAATGLALAGLYIAHVAPAQSHSGTGRAFGFLVAAVLLAAASYIVAHKAGGVLAMPRLLEMPYDRLSKVSRLCTWATGITTFIVVIDLAQIGWGHGMSFAYVAVSATNASAFFAISNVAFDVRALRAEPASATGQEGAPSR